MIKKCEHLIDNLWLSVDKNRYFALKMESVKGISLSLKKYMFPAVLLVIMVMVLVLYRRLGGGGVMVIHEALTGLSGSSEVGRLRSDNLHHQGHENMDEHLRHQRFPELPRSHIHEKEVHFVLHESALGAPEFIGRNDRKATFIDFDPAGTFLNAPGHALAEVFNADSYKEKNIAIGLAITTREQIVSNETLAKELPFFTV